jgi:hypothetical protein
MVVCTGRNPALTESGQHVFGFAEEIFLLGEELLNSVQQRPTARLPRPGASNCPILPDRSRLCLPAFD